MAINTVSAPIGNIQHATTSPIDRKPILRKLPGIHVSEGPLCKDNRLPVTSTVSFYQHLFSLPTSVQTYLQQILASFKLKKRLDREALEGIRESLLAHFKEASIYDVKGRRSSLLAHYIATLSKRSKRSHPHDIMSFLIKLCSRKKPTRANSPEQDIINQQLREIDALLRLDNP